MRHLERSKYSHLGPRPKRLYRHMNPEKANEIRRLYFRERKKQREIAAMYNIRQNTVSRIISGLVWA